MLRRRAALLAAGTACLAPWRRGLAQPAGELAGVPLERLRTGDLGGLLTVQAQLGSEPAGLWLLDTGSSAHLVDAALAAQLALDTESSVSLSTAGGRQRVPRVRLPPLRLGEAADAASLPAGAAASALAIDLQPLRDLAGGPVQGLIGMPALAGRVTRLDLAAGRLLFDAPLPGPGDALALPLRLDAGLPVLQAWLAPGVAGDCLFDTGNAGAVVLFAHAADDQLRGRPLPELISRELGGEVAVAYARSASTAIGPLRRLDVPVALERGGQARRGGHFDRLMGSLGAALFEGCRLTLDLPGSRLLVEPRDDGRALPGGFGFAVGVRGDRLVLDRVLAGGPAALAGLQPGDGLTGLEGRPAPSRPAALWALLQGREQAVFGFERGGRTWQQALARAVFFPLLS